MAKKRKRAQSSTSDIENPHKCLKTDAVKAEHVNVKHPTLCLYYDQIFTLRNHILTKMPTASKTRRRRIAAAGDPIFDRTLICIRDVDAGKPNVSLLKDFEAYSQQLSLTAGSSFNEGHSQSDLIDFALWRLFYRTHRQAHKPPHILCHGYQRVRNEGRANQDHCALAGIPGLVSHYPNGNVDTMKDAAWAKILGLLGKEGNEIMLDMVMLCGIFVAVDGGQGNYYQLSGTPLTDLPTLSCSNPLVVSKAAKPLNLSSDNGVKIESSSQSTCKSPATISFVRNRMFYARPALNAKGRVTFGLRHIHVLNRYSNWNDKAHTIHVMKYIFPKQFGLHNVFTSIVDTSETVQPFKDYTLREQEISQIARRAMSKTNASGNGFGVVKQRLPKRLRGKTFNLVRDLQKYHSRCSYHELFKHYCPRRMCTTRDRTEAYTTKSISPGTAPQPEASKPSFFALATPHSNVSAFCRAVLSILIPNDFWGNGDQGQTNKVALMQHVDRFVRLRRFENMSLHVVYQGLKLNNVIWLMPANTSHSAKTASSDMQKRKEIFMEFLYYIFDSLLIPLIRSNFHVTESNVHQNRLYYFRHDVWRSVTEPAMSTLKLSMFEEIKTHRAKKILDARLLGFSQIRLLPKSNGVRPIANLRRRVTKLQNGKVTLGRSINAIMTPVFNALAFEKTRRPALVGSALFSVGDMYPKLKAYVQMHQNKDRRKRRLYFAKADAKSCFDTIPQEKLLRLVECIASEDEYRIARHAEIKVSDTHHYGGARSSKTKPARRFVSTARAATDFPSFEEVLGEDLAKERKNTVFVDGVVQTSQKKRRLLELLQNHVERNIIKIGKKFFRQKAGIPQGSILSSLLCNFFYAQLEKERFGFLDRHESILLRLIDDFLLITTNKEDAKKFLQIMHDGVDDYGIEVNRAKSLANFEVVINGHQVPRLDDGPAFPYCGNMINTRTLEITKDRDRRKATVMADTLTVDLSKTPGKTFYRKALNAFKIQTHKMFLDTNFNSPNTVLSTIYQNFMEAAMKYYRYGKSMDRWSQPHLELLTGTILDLVDLAFILIKNKHKLQVARDYDCAVSKCQIQWLAAKAFHRVLCRKQSKYRGVLAWLDDALRESTIGSSKEAKRLNGIVNKGNAIFKDYKY
ncbi:hypothetical protein N7G274_001592 [Stereocaulon virgatum]|uniref:Telomerase reverse transcriptase n=1 Tax=Stereocaulon virgatum TaxID=373712 RepID=A0ABR4AK51_9LECA